VAVHITNRFLDLEPVLGNIIAAAGLHARLIYDEPAESRVRVSISRWVLIARDEASLARGAIGERGTALATRPDVGVWTDGFNNLLRVMKTSPLSALGRLYDQLRGS
jgi:hypothetical protein